MSEAEHALRLSRAIQRYWVARGYSIKVSVDVDHITGMYVIRSNIGPRGFPPK